MTGFYIKRNSGLIWVKSFIRSFQTGRIPLNFRPLSKKTFKYLLRHCQKAQNWGNLDLLTKRIIYNSFDDNKIYNKWDSLSELVRFVQFKKREKQPWRSVTFSKVAGFLNCTNGTEVRKTSNSINTQINSFVNSKRDKSSLNSDFVYFILSTWNISDNNSNKI